MTKFQYIITDPEGIHARPAGLLVKKASSFSSAVTVCTEGRIADCKRLLAVMALGIKKGQEVTFTIEGEDEEAAGIALQSFMKENL